jgi:glycosyltransferase involved in cell wall biosynthesis
MEQKTWDLYLDMIVADFESPEMLKRAINSVKDYVDDVYITITYKKEKPAPDHPLVLLLSDYSAHISYFKWVNNFAKARQYALDEVPHGPKKYIIWIDSDDVFDGGENIPKLMEECIQHNIASIYFNYLYAVDLNPNGSIKEVLIEHKRERIIRNDHTWKWVGNLHETLIEQKQENMTRVGKKECRVIHLSNKKRGEDALKRNIEILEAQIKEEEGKDPRTVLYLAKAYVDEGRADEKNRDDWFNRALVLFNQYLEGTGQAGTSNYRTPSGWREERASAWGNVGEIAIIQKQPDVAIDVFHQAIDEGYEFPIYYVDLAMAYVMKKDFKRAKHWLYLATTLSTPNTTVILFPKDLKIRALQVSIEVNMNEHKIDLALEDVKKLYELTPDEQTKNDRDKIQTLVDFNKACQSVVFLGKYLEKNNNKDRIPHLLQSLTPDMAQEKFAAEMRHRFNPIKIWGQKEIAILCGPGYEKWSPKSVDSGIGGSEEAVIQMAKELSKLGWQVTVYANPLDDAGNYDGVEYKPWYDLNPLDSFNVLILWRSIGFVDANPQAKCIFVWLHDVPNNPDFTEERVNKVDKIIVLSNYHKSLIRLHKDGKFIEMPGNKIMVSSNGIPDITISSNIKRNLHKMIYMSSPDRGLIYLLNNWKLIRHEVPDALLSVCYGFNTFNVMHKNNPSMQQWKKNILELMKQPGITHHGRLGHQALHEEIASSGVWAYSTDFQEISCIAAMKAQSCGACPVVTNFAALQETVRNGVKVDVDITDTEGRREYFKTLIKVLKNPIKQNEGRASMMSWARDYFHWSHVAKKWDMVMNIILQDPIKNFKKKEGVSK